MVTYVLDTSVVVQWFHHSREKHVKEAARLGKDLQADRIRIILPDILPLELLNAFIKGKNAAPEKSYSMIANLFKIPITITEVSLPVLEITAVLMKQYGLTSYDAYFLALAQYEGCKLISDDQKAHGRINNGTILMLKDY